MKMTVGKRMYVSILTTFALFAVLFIVFQQYREKEYKIETLNLRLQDFNVRLGEELEHDGKDIDGYVNRHGIKHLRVTVVNTAGNVIYDNLRKDYKNIANHRERKEIREAIANGSGYDINRVSNTIKGDFFYSATYFPKQHIVIRSALPYDNDLAKSLRADQHFIWFALVVMSVLSVMLYRFIKRLDSNISKLRLFAQRADRGESLDTEDLVEFPDDELGEISESIIKIYIRLQKTKEEQNILKRQLTQNIAHELKTPVASIQGYLETIIENPEIKEETKAQFLERCYIQSKRLGSLLNDISILNRLDDGSKLMEFEQINVAQTIRQIVRETALEMKEKNMKFINNTPEYILINGAPGMVYSIFRNLTDNAIAYAGEGTTITLDARKAGEDRWQFTFSDNGVGVDSKHLPRLFERFYRVDKGRSRKLGGTGLGLAIVKNAVLLHGGTIKAENARNGGLKFEFSLAK
ncbi:MAG: sensor histidine kinase [Prevotella sp.]